MKGTLFDIKEFSIHDGPGARVTVFMKGCPLRCRWCHNPEGMSTEPQRNLQTGRTVGTVWEAQALAEYLNKFRGFFDSAHGGVTFSGGEPTAQAAFLMDCAGRLPGIHKLLDTSGFCEPAQFAETVRFFDAVYFDLKLADEKEHERYTGVSNRVILENLQGLMEMDRAVTIRMPMIPRITDTEENLAAAERLIGGICRRDTPVHLLAYNSLAGGKYPVYGMEYPLKDWYRENQKRHIRDFAQRLRERGYEVLDHVNQ